MGRVNEADLDWETVDREGAGWRRKQLADAAGGGDLGCSLYELPAGSRAWPYHYHTANAVGDLRTRGRGVDPARRRDPAAGRRRLRRAPH